MAMLRTMGTYVVVNPVAAKTQHPSLDVCIVKGTGEDHRYIDAHRIASAIGVDISCSPSFTV